MSHGLELSGLEPRCLHLQTVIVLLDRVVMWTYNLMGFFTIFHRMGWIEGNESSGGNPPVLQGPWCLDCLCVRPLGKLEVMCNIVLFVDDEKGTRFN